MLLVESGAAQKMGIDDRELAIVAAGHSGEEEHLHTVRSLIAKAGLDANLLACTPAMPLHGPTALRLACEGEIPRPIYSPCSGKHAGMLALCIHYGWTTEGYLGPEHPVQQLIANSLAELIDLPADRFAMAYGSCGAPTFGASIRAWATAYARLASARATAGPSHEPSLRRVAAALQAHPRIVAGSNRLDTDLIELSEGQILSRQAGEGLQCLGLTGKGLGIVLKVDDGSHRATAPVVASILASLGVLDEHALSILYERHSPLIRTAGGKIVGQIVADFTLKWSSPQEMY
jgi:L-asparaginase II